MQIVVVSKASDKNLLSPAMGLKEAGERLSKYPAKYSFPSMPLG